MMTEAMGWSFQFHYHRDMMNAAVHMAPPRFSPITVDLCLEIEEVHETPNEIPGWSAVRQAIG
jgi:hypothetical protein